MVTGGVAHRRPSSEPLHQSGELVKAFVVNIDAGDAHRQGHHGATGDGQQFSPPHTPGLTQNVLNNGGDHRAFVPGECVGAKQAVLKTAAYPMSVTVKVDDDTIHQRPGFVVEGLTKAAMAQRFPAFVIGCEGDHDCYHLSIAD